MIHSNLSTYLKDGGTIYSLMVFDHNYDGKYMFSPFGTLHLQDHLTKLSNSAQVSHAYSSKCFMSVFRSRNYQSIY